jgi:hypothetical protein
MSPSCWSAPDHHLPDRRATRAGAPLADREAEIADVALPLLTSALSVWLGQPNDRNSRKIKGERDPRTTTRRRPSSGRQAKTGRLGRTRQPRRKAYENEQHHQERRARRAPRRRCDRRPGQRAGHDLLLEQRLSHRPVLGLGHPDRRRHARLHQHDQRARRRRERRQDHLRGVRDRLRHQEVDRVLRAGQVEDHRLQPVVDRCDAGRDPARPCRQAADPVDGLWPLGLG